MQRVREGFVLVPNPRNPSHVLRVSLAPAEVSAIVFWSRDYGRLLPHLDELDDRGLHACFHLTLTGYGPPFELRAPAFGTVVRQLEALAKRYGPERVIWRYDPILLGSRHDLAHHRARFHAIAQAVAPYVRRCVVSFLDEYPSAMRELRAITEQTGETFGRPSHPDRLALALSLLEAAQRFGLALSACCEPDLLPNVPRARCIDPDLIRTFATDPQPLFREAPTRKGCGCVLARDIGAYHTCAHGCVYCYACESPSRALRNAQQVDAHANTLGPRDIEAAAPPRRTRQLPLLDPDASAPDQSTPRPR